VVKTSTPSPSAAARESLLSATSAAPVSRPSTVLPASPAAVESPEPATPAATTQQEVSVSRLAVVSPRTTEKTAVETSPLRQGAAQDTRVSESSISVISNPVKESSSLDSDENLPDKENDSAERNLNGQAILSTVPQNKKEQPAFAVAPVREPLPASVLESSVQQVKEHLSSRVYKTGTEQVCIRLTPENLGELKLTLRMENQQLKVDIVAENSMVRDTLLKHTDSLRETLAKQNISMESFNVSTGGNGGSPGRDQSDWRELAKQQQFNNAWMSADGYRNADKATNQGPKYMAQASHSMVDVHF
jgi:flagellar hook-length control protein FliK